ncbi:MAG: DNA polymerase III subunit beta [Pseudomonadota bacterium]
MSRISIVLHKKEVIVILNILTSLSSRMTSLISCVRMQCKDDHLKFIISNDAIFCFEQYSSVIQSQGFDLVVDIFKLCNIVKNCPGDDLQLCIDNNILSIVSLTTVFKINTIGNIDVSFPIIDNCQLEFSLSAKQLFNLINYVEFCALKNNFQSSLNAISLQYKAQEKKLYAIGVDGHRLGIASTNIDSIDVDEDFNILLSLHIGQKIPVFLNNILDSRIDISITATSLVIKSEYKKGVFALMSRELVFPDYTHLIPINNSNVIKCNVLYLTNVLKRIISISTEIVKSVKVNLGNDSAVVYTKQLSENHNNLSKEEIKYSKKFSYHGQNLELALNADYLIQIFSKLHNDDIEIYIKDAKTAVLLLYNSDLRYIVMPLRI